MPGATTNGLPYPLGTEPVRDGDNAIKNLADALDRRGYGYRTEARTVVVTPNAAGGFAFNFARPFASGQPICAWTITWAGSNMVPVAGIQNVTLTGASGVACNAMGGQAITTGFNVFYIAVGYDPNV